MKISKKKSETELKMGRLISLRYGSISLFLLAYALPGSRGAPPVDFLYLPALLVLVNSLYSYWLRTRKFLAVLNITQVVTDIAVITCGIYYTGGAESILFLLYCFPIIYAGFHSLPKSLAASALCSILYLGVLVVQIFSPSSAGSTARLEGLLAVPLYFNVLFLFLVGAMSSFYGYLRSRKEVESAMARECSKSIISSMIDLLVIFDGKGIVRGVNCAVTQLLGYSPKQMIGQRLAGILDSNQEEAALLEKLRRFGEIRDTELSFISDQGERVPLLFNGSSLKDERGRTIAFLLVARDMREIRKMIADLREARSNLETKVMARTAELVEAQKKLVESEKYAAIGQLAAGAAHELNNPLTAVMGHSEMILLTLERDHQWYESVKGIVEAAERCRNIVSALLSYSRRKARSFRRFNLNGVVEKSLIACQGVAGMDRIRLRKEYWPEPVFVEGDEDGICQSFSEIIVNALEAMPASGDLVIRTRRDNGSAMVEFMDTGGGIVEDQIYRIFDPFFSTKENRIGLGLSKCQNIARDHGGVVEVCSTPDEGSTFRISLPCKNSGGGL